MSDNEQDFDALRRLLALKRHEVPPPGYFEDFSGNVLGRIRAGQATAKLPWILRFFQIFESRPAYPVVFASSLCMLLLYGIVSVEQSPEISTTFAQQVPGISSDPLATVSYAASSGSQILGGIDTNSPVDVSANTSIFGSSQPSPYFQQASFSPGAN